ncbi:MAG: group 1 truncated hemoglobin [Betaproteobacteria bacterium]|nr:group 1 truncated hemoglobin [Betaproteobacteria bacterium]
MLRKLSFLLAACGIALGGAVITSNAVAQEGTRIGDDPALFQAFGEKAGLARIMDDFMVNLLADPRTRTFFEKADQKRIKEQLVDQFCYILNGPCEYQGAKMKPMHAELGITRENFNALVEQLQFAMDKNNVPYRAQNKLLAVLAPMHRDIVTR